MANPKQIDHVFTRNGTFYARLSVPLELVDLIGRKEWQKALGTKKRGEAVLLAQPWLTKWRNIIAIAQYAKETKQPFVDADKPDLTVAEINRVDEALYELALILDNQAHTSTKTQMIDARHWLGYLATGEADFESSFINFMSKSGIVISPYSILWDTRYDASVAMFKKGVEQFVNIHKERTAKRISRMTVEQYVEHTTSAPDKPRTVSPLVKPADASKTITEYAEIAIAANPKVRDNPKEVSRWNNVVKNFVNFVGEDKPANYVSWSDANAFIMDCEHYPAIRNAKAFEGLGFKEKVEKVKADAGNGIEHKVLTTRTIVDWRGKLAIIFKAAVREGHTSLNPFEGHQIRVGRESVEKTRWTDVDLKRMIQALKSEHRERYLIALFLLYHGCRDNELTNTKVGDIVCVDGVWALNIINPKNKGGKRLLPIHSKLIQLGFIEYLDLNRPKDKPLFRNFSYEGRMIEGVWRKASNPSSQYSNWFNSRFLTGLGIKTPEKTLHSLRHTWVSVAAKSIGRVERMKLSGHTPEQIHDDIYTHFTLSELKTEIDKVQFVVDGLI